MGNGHGSIDNLIFLNELQQIGKPLTGNLADIVGTIGPTPWLQTKEGQQTIFDMIVGSPGSAIGKVSKAAVTGGEAVKKVFNPQIKKMMNKLFRGKRGKELLKSEFSPDELEWMRKLDEKKALESLENIKMQNKISASRLRAEKILDKHKMPHETDYINPINYLLDKVRNLKRN